MDKERFWELIDEARIEDAQRLARIAVSSQVSWFAKLLSRLTGAPSKVPEVNRYDQISELLVDKLAHMEIGDIVRWHQINSAYQKLSYKMKLWAAAYVINGGCSDDGFDYFRGWLTAQGRDVFMNALANPDSLADVDVAMDEAFDQSMLGVGCDAYFKKAGIAVPDRDYGKFRAACEEYPFPLTESEQQDLAADIQYASDIDLEWEEDELETVVPDLCAKFY